MRKNILVFLILVSFLQVNACEDHYLGRSSYLLYGRRIRVDRIEILHDILKKIDFEIDDPPFVRNSISTMDGEKIDFSSRLDEVGQDMNGEQKNLMLNDYLKAASDARKKGAYDKNAIWANDPRFLEFKLYLDGIVELAARKNGDWTLPQSFQLIFTLPEKDRKYRSVWSVYMLASITGRTPKEHLKDKTPLEYCKMTRELVKAGFIDTCALAALSYRLGGQIAEHHPIEAIRGMLTAFVNGDPKYSKTAEIFNAVLRLDDEFLDELARKDKESAQVIMSLWLQNDYTGKKITKYAPDFPELHALSKFLRSEDDFFKPLETLLPQNDVIYAMLAAKKADKENDVEGLKSTLAVMLEIEKTLPRGEYPLYMSGHWPLSDDIYGMLGRAQIRKGDYKNAIDSFIRAKVVYDATCILENEFTLDENIEYYRDVINSKNNFGKTEQYGKLVAEALANSIAKRAFREGKYDIALEYEANESNRDLIKKYSEWLAVYNNEKLSGDERAIAAFNAAKLLYPFGDYRDIFSRNYREIGLSRLKAGKNYVDNRVLAPEEDEDMRKNYRFVAADFMFKAAEIAENKKLKALLYYSGGLFIGSKNPKEADIFYKRAVINSRGTEFSRVIDEYRWFPRFTAGANFPDEMYSVELITRAAYSHLPLESIDEVEKLFETSAASKYAEE